MSKTYNLRNVLELTISLMEEAEEEDFAELTGRMKYEFVINKLQKELGLLYKSYIVEIDTIIEAVIFISKLGRKVHVNDIVKDCQKCFNFC